MEEDWFHFMYIFYIEIVMFYQNICKLSSVDITRDNGLHVVTLELAKYSWYINQIHAFDIARETY